MSDKRTHRGRHPDDTRLFATEKHPTLRTAVAEYSWLLSRGYAEVSALKLVGDHHRLTARQRTAIMRSACSDQAWRHRRKTMTTLTDGDRRPLGIDGYNLLITVESALSDGLILIGRDDCYRDLASVHGTYRKVEETIPAVKLIVGYLAFWNIARIDWYLDQPVSNSGRLKVLMAELLEADAVQAGWNIELVPNPDRVLADYAGVVATTDSVILDRCSAWVNLAAEIIKAGVPDAWKVDLGPDDGLR